MSDNPPEQDAAARQAAELLPCLDSLCLLDDEKKCGTCRLRPAVAAALRELQRDRDSWKHCAEKHSDLRVKNMREVEEGRERVAACQKRIVELEAELERAKSSKPN